MTVIAYEPDAWPSDRKARVPPASIADRAAGAAAGWVRTRRARTSYYMRTAQAVLQQAKSLESLTDSDLAERAQRLRHLYTLRRNTTADRVMALALAGEAVRRRLDLVARPEQHACAHALDDGCLVEMATGEGKTIAAAIAAALAGWRGAGCHVLSANDYLVERDAAEVAPALALLGLTVGHVVGGMTQDVRRAAYRCDVTYTTSKEACADHLHDRLLGRGHLARAGALARAIAGEQHHAPTTRPLARAIVDEADALLVDEAGTPLVLSGGHSEIRADERFARAQRVATELARDTHFRVRERYRDVRLTSAGEGRARELTERFGGVWAGPSLRVELVTRALEAQHLYERGREYIVEGGSVIIIDPFTGRPMPDRSWQAGVHQAIEAKEGLATTRVRQTAARLAFQRFFARYEHLSGMSGTLREVAAECASTYRTRFAIVPTHRPCVRTFEGVRLYPGPEERSAAIVDEAKRVRGLGRPLLIGTRSVETSSVIARALVSAGIESTLLDASQDKDEAQKIAQAGEPRRVTIATNMAGRGTDIRLHPAAREAGGLHVIIAECNEASRIDRQLLGRAGRQGDPGSGVVIASLEDDLFQRWAARGLLALAARAPGVVRGPLARRLLRGAQRRAEAHARSRRRALARAEERSDDALAFAGPPD